MPDTIKIGNRLIGTGQPVFIIAEAGVNHNGDFKLAKELVSVAADAGADAVKFQTFSAYKLVTPRSPKAKYQLETTNAEESQYVMLKKLELSSDEHRVLIKYARIRGITFLSTPFDSESADLLEKHDVPAFKVGSGELTDLPLLRHIASKKRPMILSTGMSTMDEVAQAVRTVRQMGNEEIALLHCVSAYPAPEAEANLRAIKVLQNEFGTPVGFSDHTEGMHVAAMAVVCGACIIEKHLTLDRNLPGPDHRMSLEPDSFRKMIRDIRHSDVMSTVVPEKILGRAVKEPMPSELNTRQVARKSVVALTVLEKGRAIDNTMVGVRRPGLGIPPADIDKVIGRTVRKDLASDIPAGNIVTWEMLE